MKNLVAILWFSLSTTLLADLPYLPPPAEFVCNGKKAGDACVTEKEKPGLCVMEHQTLVCAAQTQRALSSSTKGTEVQVKEDSVPAIKNDEKNGDDGDVPIPEGCNNVPLTNSAVSLISIVLGLLMIRKIRK